MKYNMATIKRTKDKDLKDEMYERYFLKYMRKQKPRKPTKSLQDDWHLIGDESGDHWTEFGFFEVGDMTDEEIEEHVEGMRERVSSPYDCSGQVFTLWIEWHRNPCGWVSVIHRKGIDC